MKTTCPIYLTDGTSTELLVRPDLAGMTAGSIACRVVGIGEGTAPAPLLTPAAPHLHAVVRGRRHGGGGGGSCIASCTGSSTGFGGAAGVGKTFANNSFTQ